MTAFKLGDVDGEVSYVRVCACGAVHKAWSVVISNYKDDPTTMPCCGRKVYFTMTTAVVEVREPVAAMADHLLDCPTCKKHQGHMPLGFCADGLALFEQMDEQ